FEVGQLMLAEGEPLHALKDKEVATLGRNLVKLGVEVVAILFLNSYVNPAHEQRAKELLEASHPGLFVSASHELSQEYREFERCSTVAASACGAISPRSTTTSAPAASPARSWSCSRPAASTRPSRRSRTACACSSPVRRPASSARRRCATRSASTA